MPKATATATATATTTATATIVAEATNTDVAAPVTTVPQEVYAGLKRAGYASETTEGRTVDLALQSGDTKEASAAYAAGRLGAAFTTSDFTESHAILVGEAIMMLAGNGAEAPRCAEAIKTLNHKDNAAHLAALTVYFPEELAAGKKSVPMEKSYALARSCWSKVLYRAGLRVKSTPAATTTTNAAGLAVVTDAAEAKAAKETAAEKASANADKLELNSSAGGSRYLSIEAAKLTVKIEKYASAFDTDMRAAVLAFKTATDKIAARIEAAQ
jgi:hypothetical protein